MKPCSVTLAHDILIIENSRILRQYRWNGGNLISQKIADKQSGQVWELTGSVPDFALPGVEGDASEGALTVRDVPQTTIAPTHAEATVDMRIGDLSVRRVFRIYADCPAIACDFYLKGVWRAGDAAPPTSTIEHIVSPRPHLKLTGVQFFDISDRRNTMVQTHTVIPYRFENQLIGNLFLLQDALSDAGLFILKEAPCSDTQLAWPGYDMIYKRGDIALAGIGVAPQDVRESEWTRCYGFVSGVAGGSEYALLSALRSYQGNIRMRTAERDEMILLNTWGDCNHDAHIGAAFALAEIEAAQRLGLSHFQLDDGWQKGRTTNSAYAGGTLSTIWEIPGFWDVHPERFPRGLAPVVQRARELGVQVGLWFNPSKDNSYVNWQKDAAVLIGMYQTYGIRTFKIDGVDMLDKQADRNMRAMLDAVVQATNGDVVFNLDITAGHRWGYHHGNEYGNLFLENRYTDAYNYYPHWTLRNLWMLARYLPAQSLQIEFLNKWRNPDKYPAGDPLAPSRVPFDYCFAITMMAQPLGWFEAAYLPEEAFSVAPLITEYRRQQERIHSGQIFPIGEEPSGTGWTGFQSIIDNQHGYLLVFRELNDQAQASLAVWNLAGKRVQCTHVLGHGADFAAMVSCEGKLAVQLPEVFTFALYEYATA